MLCTRFPMAANIFRVCLFPPLSLILSHIFFFYEHKCVDCRQLASEHQSLEMGSASMALRNYLLLLLLSSSCNSASAFSRFLFTISQFLPKNKSAQNKLPDLRRVRCIICWVSNTKYVKAKGKSLLMRKFIVFLFKISKWRSCREMAAAATRCAQKKKNVSRWLPTFIYVVFRILIKFIESNVA